MHDVQLDDWSDSANQSSVLSSLFIKYVWPYYHWVCEVKVGNTWNMEVKWCVWLGRYNLVVKYNYIAKTLYRVKILYARESMDSVGLEWKYQNTMFLIINDDNSIVLDNLWNKWMVPYLDFSTAIERSRFIIVGYTYSTIWLEIRPEEWLLHLERLIYCIL